MNTINPKTSPDAREVAVALEDFFADKPVRTRRELAPFASKLAWAIKKLIGIVRSEDLDAIQQEFPTQTEFSAFTDKVVALNRRLTAAQKPVAGFEQLAGLSDLASLEAAILG